jgi:hypothetical protein
MRSLHKIFALATVSDDDDAELRGHMQMVYDLGCNIVGMYHSLSPTRRRSGRRQELPCRQRYREKWC